MNRTSTWNNNTICSPPDTATAPNTRIRSGYCLDSVYPTAPTKLDPNFKPGPGDVICGRGKLVWNHPGNKRLRRLIGLTQPNYQNAKTKLERTILVTEIVDKIRAEGTGFVQQQRRCNKQQRLQNNKDQKQWIEVGDHLAREKVGQMLRDALSNKYKSSAKAKKSRRKESFVKDFENLEKLVHSNQQVCEIMSKLSMDIQNSSFSDDQVLKLLNDANSKMLVALKSDKSLLQLLSNLT